MNFILRIYLGNNTKQEMFRRLNNYANFTANNFLFRFLYRSYCRDLPYIIEFIRYKHIINSMREEDGIKKKE